MNKRIFILLLCMVAGLSVSVQARQKKDNKKGLKFGLRLGFNRSNVAFKDNGAVDLETTAKGAINGGLYARWYLLKGRVIIQPELLYSREGFVYDSTFVAGENEEVKTRLSFMNIPFNIIVRPSKRFNLQLGPSFGYMVNAVQKSNSIDRESVLDLMNRPEFALNFGLGFNVMKIFSVNVRYKHGLTQLTAGDFTAAKENPLEAVELFNRMFQVSVGLNLFKRSLDFGGSEARLDRPRHFANRRAWPKPQY